MSSSASAPVNIRNARILVVDDNRVNRHLLVAVLQRGGFPQVEMAEDGIDALAKIEANAPDLILLDLMMPKLDGFEVCRRLRNDASRRDLPILVQSSLSSSEDRTRAFSVGATDFVSKPINATELLSRVRIHLENQALLRDLQGYRRRRQGELALARSMQERLLPAPSRLRETEADLGLSLSAHFEPSSELGGDFWDLRRDGRGRLIVWLVDFSGHGVGAALNTFRLHAILRQMDLNDFDPADHLREVNERVCPLLRSGQFATMLVGVVDAENNTFHYASAGAPAPMVWQAGDAAPEFGDSSGLPVGILASTRYQNRDLALPVGGRLFLYSDGASELWTAEDTVLGEEGLLDLVRGHMHQEEDAGFLAGLLGSLTALGSFDDDVTALVLTRRA
ncbi:SpoIIE family protein phosphatase [Skermanella rosea]|uniref:PP2C family protein-serine/threonine phosphatase n=1 Tax=Skermanella rosea TaxID=1817965 RepID=UPI00193169A5|nr:SpoIIE family protein phosphatase [Skermanella rosea]UEM05041.1 SpoIIE family protein phosphatase [Skermanella rosea]